MKKMTNTEFKEKIFEKQFSEKFSRPKWPFKFKIPVKVRPGPPPFFPKR
jgi:hypothetical protein